MFLWPFYHFCPVELTGVRGKNRAEKVVFHTEVFACHDVGQFITAAAVIGQSAVGKIEIHPEIIRRKIEVSENTVSVGQQFY